MGEIAVRLPDEVAVLPDEVAMLPGGDSVM